MSFSRAITVFCALLVVTSAVAAAPRATPTPKPKFRWPWEKATPTPRPATPRPKPTPRPTPTPVPPRVRPAPTPVVALPNYDRETSVRLQIFLDNNNFGPGKIDGKMGEFFRKALLAYKRANGMEPTGTVDAFLAEVPEAYTQYTIPPEALDYIGPVSGKPSVQAKFKALRYGSLLEFVAERFHAAEEFLREINPGIDFAKLKPGDTLNVPNVRPFEIEKLSEGFIEPNPEHAGRKLVVDTVERFLEVRDADDRIIAEFPITPGSQSLPAPIGTWKILGIATMPWFRHDEGVLNRGVRTDDFHNLPPGPNNPVGVLWMGLNKPGIGIHGTNNPETIGRAASHGCIRTANWDAARIKDMVSKGAVVEIF